MCLRRKHSGEKENETGKRRNGEKETKQNHSAGWKAELKHNKLCLPIVDERINSCAGSLYGGLKKADLHQIIHSEGLHLQV